MQKRSVEILAVVEHFFSEEGNFSPLPQAKLMLITPDNGGTFAQYTTGWGADNTTVKRIR